MTQNTRILIVIGALIVTVAGMLGIDAIRRRNSPNVSVEGQGTLVPGSIPILVNGEAAGGFIPDDLDVLEQTSFVDAEEGKTQEGWLLRDILLLHLEADELAPDSRITVTSSSRNKTVQLTWAEVDDPSNKVMFDLSGRGTLKLVSILERLDVRDEWVQDVDKIEVET